VFCVESTIRVEDAGTVDTDGVECVDTTEEVMLTSTGTSPVAGCVEAGLVVLNLLDVQDSEEDCIGDTVECKLVSVIALVVV